MNNEAKNLIFGNVKLAEDRIPSILLVFRQKLAISADGATFNDREEETGLESNPNDDQSISSIKKHTAENFSNRTFTNTRTGFVQDARYYFEAEKPLSQFLKQRRRWINSIFAAFLWVIHEGWIWNSKQPLYIKVFAYLYVLFNIIYETFKRFVFPASLVTLNYNAIRTISAFISPASVEQDFSVNKSSDLAAKIVTFIYLTIYAIFMVAHTPRAVPIKDASGKPTKNWRNDRKSAYRPVLFALSFIISAIQTLLFLILMIAMFVRLGWHGIPPMFRATVLLSSLPWVLAFLVGIFNSKRPNIDSFLIMLRATPVFIFSSLWYFVWVSSYASARVSDLSWGKFYYLLTINMINFRMNFDLITHSSFLIFFMNREQRELLRRNNCRNSHSPRQDWTDHHIYLSLQ